MFNSRKMVSLSSLSINLVETNFCYPFISQVCIVNKMAQQLRPSKSGSKKPNIDWSRREEADNLIMTARNLAYKD